jgi:hypothetical protein
MVTPSFAKPLLRHWGIAVSDIPTSAKEESDFLAAFGTYKVLIEEKTKIDNPTRLSQRVATLSKGEVHGASTPLVRDNRLSGLVGKAASQLLSSAEKEHDFRLVWFTSTGVDAEAKFHQFIATIYGTTNILEMNASYYRRCYFFRNSDFHRYARVIDGAIVAHVSGSAISAKLCLNPLSPRFSALKNSSVVAPFGIAVEDPVALEQEKEVFVVDSDINRNDENALLAFLQLKYGTLPLMKFDLDYLSASVLVGENER